MQNAIAIAGIHTDIGKTIVAAVITEALGADYWKPVQAGNLEHSDSITVAKLLSNTQSKIHPEAARLNMPASPHTAARAEGKTLDHTTFTLPQTENILVVETAGGLHSPIDERSTMADFITYNNLPVFLVTRHYLGSINHTLLCLEVLRTRGIQNLGIIVNGHPDEASEDFIRQFAPDIPVAHIPEMEMVDATHIKAAAEKIKPWLQQIVQHG
jgi:dethiobiotin synthetase